MSPRKDRRIAAGVRRLAAGAALALTGGCATAAPPATPAPAPAPAPASGPEYRIYDYDGQPVSGLEALAEALGEFDVVLVGEQHDDAGAHRFQHDLLRALAAGERPVTLGLEMFERDVQPVLDAYLAGSISEPEFLGASRPWPNYATDYRPLVEWAREQGWPVLATNVPRPLAAAVAQRGLDALQAVDDTTRSFAAAQLQCPEDGYYRRFVEAMSHHPAPPGSEEAAEMEQMIPRLYEAQCLRDETMAESIVEAQRGGRFIVHVNGAFHSDHGEGIVPRLQRRRSRLPVAIISLIPAADVGDAAAVAEHQGIADFVVLTRDDPARGEDP